MNTKLDLKQTERNSFKLSAYADGTADMSLGLVMILLGTYPITRELFGVAYNILFFFVVLGLIIFAQIRIKARLTPSRIGLVNFGEKTQRRLKVAILITFVLVCLTAATWYLSAQGYMLPKGSVMGAYGFDILIGVIVLAIFGAMAYTLELSRYYFYGLLLGASFPLQTLLPVYSGFPVLAAGVVIVVVGAVLLTRFLKEFPASVEEEV
jgi:hypothetical protein